MADDPKPDDIPPEAWEEMDRYARQESHRRTCAYRGSRVRDTPGSFFTYRHLLDYLLTLTDAQLRQNVMTMNPSGEVGEAVRLRPVFAAGTVEEMCHVDGSVETPTHSADDFRHHPEQVILLEDGSPYSKDGDSYYTLGKDEQGMYLEGNVTGKRVRPGEED